MPLPDVAQGDPHVAAHNTERHLINDLEEQLASATPPLVKVQYDGDMNEPRPDAIVVYWVMFPGKPTNAQDDDFLTEPL